MSHFCKVAILCALICLAGRSDNRESLSECDDMDGSLCMCVIEKGPEIQSYNLTHLVPTRDTFSSLEACKKAVEKACQKACVEFKP